MYRFFDAVICPLLDATTPSVMVEIGSDNGHQTELLANWCAKHGALLHSVDPLPKYDVDEWAARWPGVIRFHRDLSLNALAEIGQVDVACIDGDHNWYTVSRELEILGRSARAAEQPFPLTLLHDVGWPYGRRDLYYDPETIPGEFRHPHRKGGLSPSSRAPMDRGFNDHLENAIHEGTPRNGVLTAAEDFVAQYDENLILRTLPGINGLGIIVNAAVAESLGQVWTDVFEAPGLQRVLNAVEDDRLQRLTRISKLERDLLKERNRVDRAQSELGERVEHQRELDTEITRLRSDIEGLRRDLTREQDRVQSSRAKFEQRIEHQRTLDAEIERLRAAERTAREEAGSRLRAHQAQAETALRIERASTKEREAELATIDQQLYDLQRGYTRLRQRRSVRLALNVARLAKPAFRLRRGLLGRPGRAGGPKSENVAPPVKEPEPRAETATHAALEYRFGDADTGRFYAVTRQLIADGVPNQFLAAWSASEEEGRRPRDSSSVGPQPLVSIIMPTYNRAGLIVDAITSVLEQSYDNWELLVCDDASEDDTETVVRRFGDMRIFYEKFAKTGAAGARNAGQTRANGDLIAYLDSDNLWHPQYLETMTYALVSNPGRYVAYCKYVDITLSEKGARLKKFDALPFDYNKLATKNFIDLNTLVHRRLLTEHFGGFNQELVRQQDWDLTLKFTFLREPLYIDRFLMLYRRCKDWKQITSLFQNDTASPAIIRSAVAEYHRGGLPSNYQADLPSLSVVSWDICRNHFSKAYNIAEAMAPLAEVQLVGFRFFDEPVFPPYAQARPSFDNFYLTGGSFPEWKSQLARAVANIRGDVVYAVKPRLPSLGVALLANYHFGKPVILEMNDLESVVTSPKAGPETTPVRLDEVDPRHPELVNPYGQLWTGIMEAIASQVPLRVTHNSLLDEHFGGGAFFLRNPKDERHFDPDQHDREEVRRRLGFAPHERVLLFGGMVRRHKGVFEFLQLLERATPEYRLLIVGSRETPDQAVLKREAGNRVKFIEPVDRNEMAALNLASDAVILWLDPGVPASKYQMPFKLTDALAMKVPIFANDIGDLGELGRRGYLRLVPYGEIDELLASLDAVMRDHDTRQAMVEMGRRLYLREFSYAAVRGNLPLMLRTAAGMSGVLPVAEQFTEFFSTFCSRESVHLPTKATTAAAT